MKVVITAGGKGTRIASIAKDIPKPMIKIAGVPVLEREIYSLRDQGFKDIIITASHLGQVIMDYFGDGSKFGVKIEYFYEQQPLGTAGALFKLKDKLKEDFLLINGDLVFDVDFQRFVKKHEEYGGLVTLLTHPNSHPYDSGLIVTDKNGAIQEWLAKEDERPEFYKNRVNSGLHIISPKILEYIPNDEKVDLDRQLLKPLAGTGKMFAYDSPEYIRDMGTPERYSRVEKDFLDGIIEKKNLRNKQCAVFLDRDGTINKDVGYVRTSSELELMGGASQTIKSINKAGLLAIVITNQPVIARGETTVDELNKIHNKLETLLGKDGAYIDGLYYCPHHPDKGFLGEVAHLKIDCECRKPKPGLLLKAAKDFNIDLKKSWMVGDSKNDIMAGKAAGCKTILISGSPENFGQSAAVKKISDIIELLNEENANV